MINNRAKLCQKTLKSDGVVKNCRILVLKITISNAVSEKKET